MTRRTVPIIETLSRLSDRSGGPDACWEWTGGRSHGYGIITRKGMTVHAHRASYESRHGKIAGGLFVCHSCDNRACINPSHLFLGTHDQNMADMKAKGRQPKMHGQRNGSAKLSPAQVREILSAQGFHREIAKAFGVSASTVSLIKSGKRWVEALNA